MIFSQNSTVVSYPPYIPPETVERIEDSEVIESVELIRSGMLSNVYRINFDPEEL
jgi:muconolactone delta-isomerase